MAGGRRASVLDGALTRPCAQLGALPRVIRGRVWVWARVRVRVRVRVRIRVRFRVRVRVRVRLRVEARRSSCRVARAATVPR